MISSEFLSWYIRNAKGWSGQDVTRLKQVLKRMVGKFSNTLVYEITKDEKGININSWECFKHCWLRKCPSRSPWHCMKRRWIWDVWLKVEAGYRNTDEWNLWWLEGLLGGGGGCILLLLSVGRVGVGCNLMKTQMWQHLKRGKKGDPFELFDGVN